VKPLQG
ncbi:hypothetical protein ACTA71_011159, partial [Dictyostelium dimigraforme]